MKIHKHILDILEQKINDELSKEFLIPVKCWILDAIKIYVIIKTDNANTELLTEILTKLQPEGIVDLLNKITNLVWKKKGVRIALHDGYIRCVDNIIQAGVENKFEWYYCIHNNLMLSNVVYVNGSVKRNCNMEPENIGLCAITFHKKLPEDNSPGRFQNLPGNHIRVID